MDFMDNKEEDEEENENLDSAEYSSKSDYSKAEVVKMQTVVCNNLRSKEMKEGYYNYDKFGNKNYVEDSRKEWVSSVIALTNLLSPEIVEKKYSEKIKTITDKIKKLEEKWSVEIQGNKRLPVLDEVAPVKVDMMKNRTFTGVSTQFIKGYYNRNFHSYWDGLVEIYDELYSLLNKLIHSCNYFKQQVSY